MRRIHKFAAVGISVAVFALVSAALAVSGASAAGHHAYRASFTAGATHGVPNTNIKGNPAHFKPKSLSATGHWTTPPVCTSVEISFTIKNHESKQEVIKFTGTNGFTPFKVKLPADTENGICITKGYHGTLTGKLKSDGKKLKVHF